MKSSTTDRIEKQIELNVPPERVWRALTDYREFGAWFGVKLETPFAVGKTTRGNITHPGYTHLVMEVAVQKMETDRLFSFHWHPYAIDPKIDYSKEPPTLVEFFLEKTASGTLLRVIESGFDAIPAARRDEAFRHEQRRVDGADEKHRDSCQKHSLMSHRYGFGQVRRSSPPSATKRV